MPIQLRIQGLDAVRAEILELPAKLEKQVLLQMSQIAYDTAQQGADRHTKTGALFQSLYNRAIPNGREVGHDPQRAPYAQFVVFGSRPHTITPKNKKALRWAIPGGFAFAKSVKHPGYIGDNYMNRAADEAIRQFDRIVTEALKDTQ
jgi:hypothetical protein